MLQCSQNPKKLEQIYLHIHILQSIKLFHLKMKTNCRIGMQVFSSVFLLHKFQPLQMEESTPPETGLKNFHLEKIVV